MRRFLAVLLAATTVAVTGPAVAYVGPGAGLSMAGAFWGLLIAIAAALGFVILWPIRRLLRRNRNKVPEAGSEAGETLHSRASEGSKAQVS